MTAARREGASADIAATATTEMPSGQITTPADADDACRAAITAMRATRPADAAAILRDVLAIFPTHAGALTLLGRIETSAGRFASALPVLEVANRARPSHPATLKLLVTVLDHLDRMDDALGHIDLVLTLEPDDVDAMLTRGNLLVQLDRHTEAAAAYREALAVEPRNSTAWTLYARLLAEAAQATGDQNTTRLAIAAYRNARAQGADPATTDYALAGLGAEPAPAVAPPEYVRGLFDSRARDFDRHLCEDLGYSVPEAIAELLTEHHHATPADVVDLGCGTGLCGPLSQPLARSLTGVDISGGMLDLARARGCYDGLMQAEVVQHLLLHPGAFDIAVAADVLVYIGDIGPLFAAAHAALRDGGVFAFSTERHDGIGFVLQPSRRYAHATAYIASAAAAAGFSVEAMRPTTLRMEKGAPVAGTLTVLRRPIAASALGACVVADEARVSRISPQSPSVEFSDSSWPLGVASDRNANIVDGLGELQFQRGHVVPSDYSS